MRVLLVMDVGNSSITMGVFREENGKPEAVMESRLEASMGRSADEYAVLLQGILQLNGVDRSALRECMISSVVPQITEVVKEAVRRLLGIEPKTVGPGIRTGLNIRIDSQAELGSDLVANAVAALAELPPPMVIVDLGTATTLTAIDREGTLQGVVIAPGVRLSMDALSLANAALAGAPLSPPKRLIGKNTRDSMQAGVMVGQAAMVDGLLDRMIGEMGEERVTAVITGGLASLILPFCKREYVSRPQLTLEGLCRIAAKNRK